MKQLDYEMISFLQVLVDKKMDSLEQAIENKRTSPFTVLYLSKYAEIDAILRDMKAQAN